jgi:hypothetical protein
MPINEEKEKEFQEWLESINFVNGDGDVLPVKLTSDESLDPDGDRGEE